MKSIPLSELVANRYFDQPVFLDKGFLLLTPDSPVTPDLVKRLQKWRYTQVLTDGNSKDLPGYLSAGQAGVGGFAVAARYSKFGWLLLKSATCGMVRLSFQSGAVFRVSSPAASISTVPCICPHAQTASIRRTIPGSPEITLRTTSTAPAHQSAGRCSAHP